MSDFKFIAALLLTLLLPLGIFLARPQWLPDSRLWTRDEHLSFFRSQLQAPADPEVIFLGTSATMNNVDTAELNLRLAATQDPRRALNLGVNWFGLDLQAVLLEEWLKTHRAPQIVVLDVPLLPHYESHPNFDKVASPAMLVELLFRAPWTAGAPVLMLGPRLICQLAAETCTRPLPDRLHRTAAAGQVRIEMTPEEESLAAAHARQLLALGRQTPPEASALKKIYRDLAGAHHTAALKRIARLCREHRIRLVLLSFPQLRLYRADSGLETLYRQLAEYALVPQELLLDPSLWRDQTHLKPEGARPLVPWLLELLRRPPTKG